MSDLKTALTDLEREKQKPTVVNNSTADNVEQVTMSHMPHTEREKEREGIPSNEVGVIVKQYGYEVLIQFEP